MFALKEKSSKKVLDYFIEKAWGKSILKSNPLPHPSPNQEEVKYSKEKMEYFFIYPQIKDK